MGLTSRFALVLALVGCSASDGDTRGHQGGGIDLDGSEGTTEAPATDATGGSDSEADTKDDGNDNCDGGGALPEGQYDFSIIWIANSLEGTVSKVDTVTGSELARYRTGPEEADPDPSRTAVNLDGDVAVVNRTGSILKIFADPERCPDADGDGDIATSSGAHDVLPWGEDECVAWDVPLPFTLNLENANGNTNTFGPRPVAWEGRRNTETCVGPPARVWVGWYGGLEQPDCYFRRLDGESGATSDEVVISDIGGSQFGPYGGAVDGQNNFWSTVQPDKVVRIDEDTLEYTVYTLPEPGIYGIAIDGEGNPWVTGSSTDQIYWLDPNAGAFISIGSTAVPGGDGLVRGIAIDRQGRGWVAGNDPCRLVAFDAVTRTLGDLHIPLPGCVVPVGVAIDADGHVWAVDYGADAAYQVDADTYQVLNIVEGFNGPYTYSDMTGSGLGTVFLPEG